ncbi:MAG: hypothetical protein NC905_05060 [Candidatus Omnitrophica bacterium]|nr:hypothetical protein [Candidatus Omnitrophota bacterium]
MKQKAVQVVLIVVILLAIGIIVNNLKPRTYNYYERVLVDVQANKVFLHRLEYGKPVEFPVESPFSQGKNAYPAIQCKKDGTIFAIEERAESPDNPSLPTIIKCPVCGRADVDVPQLPEGKKSMDIHGPVQVVKPSPMELP